jgi:penicillin-binding protein 1A
MSKFWKIFAAGFIGFNLFILLMSVGFFGFMPSVEELQNPDSALATEVISVDDQVIGKYYSQNRSLVTFEQLPLCLQQALMATEDIRFYSHTGVDLKAIARAVSGVLTFSSKGGGSTITQQLAKNLFPRKRGNKIELVIRKFKEWIISVKLERQYTKEEIMALYLGTVEFSDNAFGVMNASKTYFSKPVDSLKVEEAAVLVGMLKAPYTYNPRVHPEASTKRRNVVLDQMYRYNFISEAERDSLFELPIKLDFNPDTHEDGIAPYFREHLRAWMKDWCKKNQKPNGENYDIYHDGLKIYTTIDSRMQRYAEQAQREHLTEWQKIFFKFKEGSNPWKEFPTEWEKTYTQSTRYKAYKAAGKSRAEIDKIMATPIQMRIFAHEGEKDTLMSPKDSIIYHRLFLQNGFLAVDPYTGHIKAWVGGISYKYFQYDHVNVNTKRQVGSTFKPFVYCAAIRDKGYSPCFQVPNQPVTFEKGDPRFNLITDWTPKNSDGKYGGMLTLKKALANSINSVTAFLMHEMSPAQVISLVKDMGFVSEIPAQPSICLGAVDASLFEMVGAYTTFVNGGTHINPIFVTRITDRSGNVLQDFVAAQNEVLSEDIAYTMVELLRGVVRSGTGMRLRFKYGLNGDILGKTGTTQNNSDGWFVGATPELVAGSWVGCEDRFIRFRSMNYGQGASTALPIWAKFFQKIYADSLNFKDYTTASQFTKPKIINTEFDCGAFENTKTDKIKDFGSEGEAGENPFD